MASHKPTTRLRELRGSGFEIAKGQPDIRGWDVRNEQGRMFGKVRELIFDIKARKVRYMVVDVLDVKELELEKRTILLPIGFAELDARDNDVIVHGITPFQLRALPRYDKDSLGAKSERDIAHVFGRNFTGTSDEDMGDNFYEHDHFNENNMYRRRTMTGGNQQVQGGMSEEERKRAIEREIERENEKQALRRDAELGTPVNFTDPDDLHRLEREERRTGETEEEYLRRTRRNRNI